MTRLCRPRNLVTLVAMVALALSATTCTPPATQAPPATPSPQSRIQPLDEGPFGKPSPIEQRTGIAARQGVRYLWSIQNRDGHWESLPVTPTTTAPDARVADGATTSLVLLALKAVEESPGDPHIGEALPTIDRIESMQIRARALRAAVLRANMGYSSPGEDIRQRIDQEGLWLMKAAYPDGTYGHQARAAQDQSSHPGARDLGNTVWAVFALGALSEKGAEVPEDYWRRAQDTVLKLQREDGGWSNSATLPTAGPSNQAMTAGALATLYLTWDRLSPWSKDCSNLAPDPALLKAIGRGLEWMARNFDPADGCESLFQVAHLGTISGHRRFGEHDWWAEGSRWLLDQRQADDSWPTPTPATGPDVAARVSPAVNTAYALLFLSQGWAYVFFNKLDYGDQAQWNNRPQDVAHLSRWLSARHGGLPVHWQLIPIERPVTDWLTAPILLMSGTRAIDLTAEQKARLKQYVLSGGFLLGEAAGNSKAFADSFRGLMRELFPELAMTPLPEDHPIYSKRSHLKEMIGDALTRLLPLEALSNGVRVMGVLSPTDLGCAWQRYSAVRERVRFGLAWNLQDYASESGSACRTGRPGLAPVDLGHRPVGGSVVGRLVWGTPYQWNPEPMAWVHADIRLRNAGLPGVATREYNFAKPVKPADTPIVHLTGVGPIQLTDTQKQNLNRYVADGGLLLVDPVGGNKAFADSFTALAGELFGPLEPVTLPFESAFAEKGKVWLRHRENLPRVLRPLGALAYSPQAGRIGVLFLPYDLTAALVGYANIEPSGLTPPPAYKFVAALLAWRSGVDRTGGPAATQPARGAADQSHP